MNFRILGPPGLVPEISAMSLTIFNKASSELVWVLVVFFLLTNTSGSAVVRPVSLVAHATVRAKRVDALSMAAQIGDRVALVDVCGNHPRHKFFKL